MVSTRRTARVEPAREMVAEPDLSNTLRKKPVRKATAKKPEPEPEPKPRATRGRKAASVPESDKAKEAALSLEPAATSKSIRCTGARETRDDTEEAHVANRPRGVAIPKPTRSARDRSKKATPVTEDLPQSDEAKPTRRARRTAGKAQPLSPKKVTQVAKACTRNTRTAGQKAALERDAQPKAAQAFRNTTRERTVSDENAGNLDPNDVTVGDEEDEVILLPSIAVENSVLSNSAAHADLATGSDASMSSGSTTPSAWLGTSFREVDNDQKEHDHTVSLSTADEDCNNDDSEDELCGPKTPMRRSSPGMEARYLASLQRTVRRANIELDGQTPISRAVHQDGQHVTPQRERYYSKKVVPQSQTRPVIVDRSSDRASECEDPRSKGTRLHDNEDGNDDVEIQALRDDGPISFEHDDGDRIEKRVFAHLQSPLSRQQDDDLAQCDDPNETIVIDEDCEEQAAAASTTVHPRASLEVEDTVIMTRSNEDEGNGFDAMSETAEDHAIVHHTVSSTPETLIWENIRQDVTISVDFEEHLARARTTDTLDQAVAPDNVSGAECGKDVDFELPPIDAVSTPGTDNFTINLNDFVDMSALIEVTKVIEMPDLPAATEHQKPAVQQVADMTKGNLAQEPNCLAIKSAWENESVLSNGRTQEEVPIPHYALPTLAFDARRKSLPAIRHCTPVTKGRRPNTSDGASMPRIVNPFQDAWWSRSRAPSVTATPVRARPSTAHGVSSAKRPSTPVGASGGPRTAVTPRERFPQLSPRQDYSAHANTVAAPIRFLTPTNSSIKQHPTVVKPSATATTPRLISSRPKQANNAVTPARADVETPLQKDSRASPQATPSERFPKLPAQGNYDEHAKTIAPSRFRTPSQKPTKRPATVQKPASLRKVVLQTGSALQSHTPVHTPLKRPATTPWQAPLTPHPAAPLRGVVAMVEVFTLEGASASAPFIALLHRLGAKTTKTWSDRITHVIFKDGSPTTLQRVRLHNKGIDEAGRGDHVHCVNSRWVTDCDTEGTRVNESDEAYAVDVAEVPRGGKRRRKSMEPSTLLNIGGNIIQNRKSSSSLSRSPLKVDSIAKADEITQVMSKAQKIADKENSGGEQASPATPAWLHPEQLVQQTAPTNRLRKLDLRGGNKVQNRRLTFWNDTAWC